VPRALEGAGVGDEQEREVRRDEQRVDLGGGLPRVEKVPNVRIVGATPMWEWVGAGATVFSD
jgi:hypothetical protein